MNHEKTDRVQQSRHFWIRWIVLGSVTVLMAVVAYLHQHPVTGMSPPGVDALCPFGGLEALWMFVSTGDLMTKIAASSFILLVASVGITILFRRAFCGQLCPLGALQEASAGVGRKFFGRKFKLPTIVDKPLRWLKYVVLAGITALTWMAGTLVVRPYDPWVAFMHLSSAELWTGFWVGAVILFGSLVASLFYDRFFCKYLCPMGALYGMVSKLGLYRVRRDESKCIDCGKCDKVCPVDLPVSTTKDVTSAECLACGLCVNACPAKGALAIAGPKNTKIGALFLTLATAVIFFGVIGLTAIPGWFHTRTNTLAEDVRAGSGPIAATPVETPAFDPDLIKGKNTFSEVAELTGIERQAFVEKFGISATAMDGPIKNEEIEETIMTAPLPVSGQRAVGGTGGGELVPGPVLAC